MKETKFRNYICWGVTALAVIALSIAFAFFLTRFEGWGEGIYRHIDAGDLWSCPGISASPDLQQDEKPS